VQVINQAIGTVQKAKESAGVPTAQAKTQAQNEVLGVASSEVEKNMKKDNTVLFLVVAGVAIAGLMFIKKRR